MTVAELMSLLATREPSDVIVVAIYDRHGDSGYYVAHDDLGEMEIEWHGEPTNAVLLGISNQDDEVQAA